MEIDTVKKNDEENPAIIGIYDVRLKIGDGARFGFGFGFGMFLWQALFLVLLLIGIKFLIGAIRLF